MPLEFWTHYWAFTSFVFGAIVGSFLNVCIWRLPRGESLSDPPSHCPNCNHRLHMLPDMVPILSQLWYRSRCRYCGVRFSWRYMWVEILTAVTFTAVYYHYYAYTSVGMPEDSRVVPTLCAMAFVSALITLFFIDLEHYVIPDITVLVAVLAAVIRDGYLIWQGVRPLWQTLPGVAFPLPLPLSILGGLLAFWLLWQFAALTSALLGREAMGAGDSLLLGAMGAFLIPWPLVLLAFLFAIALGTVGGLIGLWIASRQEQESTSAPRAQGDPTELDDSEVIPTVSAAAAEEASDPVLANERGEELPSVEEPVAYPADGSTDTRELESTSDEEAEVPLLPPGSRWGRLWTVAGTWIALGAVWAGMAFYSRSPGLGIAIGLLGVGAATGLLVFGIRQWVTGDKEWLPAMDAVFEGDPGPRFIPFGPYLVAGTLLAMFLGRPLIEWYLTSQLGMAPGALNSWPWD